MRSLAYLVILLIAVNFITAETPNACKRHGDPCSDDNQCCAGTKCHRFAKKCQTPITATDLTGACKRHGDPCSKSSECCAGAWCHSYAHRCQVQITAEELQAARQKILGKKANNY